MRGIFSFLLSEVQKYQNYMKHNLQIWDDQVIGFIVGEKTFYLSRKAIKNSGLLQCLSDAILNEHVIDLRPYFNDVESFQYACCFLNQMVGYNVIIPKTPKNYNTITEIFKKLQIKHTI
jgi:hypothetical protein